MEEVVLVADDSSKVVGEHNVEEQGPYLQAKAYFDF